jgi:hypothetical protein
MVSHDDEGGIGHDPPLGPGSGPSNALHSDQSATLAIVKVHDLGVGHDEAPVGSTGIDDRNGVWLGSRDAAGLSFL